MHFAGRGTVRNTRNIENLQEVFAVVQKSVGQGSVVASERVRKRQAPSAILTSLTSLVILGQSFNPCKPWASYQQNGHLLQGLDDYVIGSWSHIFQLKKTLISDDFAWTISPDVKVCVYYQKHMVVYPLDTKKKKKKKDRTFIPSWNILFRALKIWTYA